MYQRKRNQFQNFQVTDFYLKIGIVSFCINFYDMYENKDFIKSKIIGWCPSSKVFARKRNDDDNIAIMLDDNTWCHFPKFAIDCLIGKDMRDFWNFEDLE